MKPTFRARLTLWAICFACTGPQIATAATAQLDAQQSIELPSDKMSPRKKKAMQQRFARADLDHSGGLSRKELKRTARQAFPNLKKHFDAMDANRNGEISLKERDIWVRRQAKEKR